MKNFSLIIPARMQSSRLPRKPLIQICGRPMILRTVDRCRLAVDNENIYVATDDELIRDLCEENNVQVLITSKNCLTGTDRVAEASQKLDKEIFINVQGDEPIFEPADIKKFLNHVNEHPEASVFTGYCEITDRTQFLSPNIPKMIMSPNGYLMYASRSPVPGNKLNKFVSANRQVCIYGFSRQALEAFSQHGRKTPLELHEDIEILRFLELGFRVKCCELSDASIAVDVPEDVEAVEARLSPDEKL